MTKDMHRLAQTVASMITEDGCADSYIFGDQTLQGDFCEAYMMAWKKRIEAIQTKFATDPKFREQIIEAVRAIL